MQTEQPIWTDGDTDALFSTLGQYWVIFQWIESRIDLVLLLGWVDENRNTNQRKLAKLTNSQKLAKVRSTVLRSPLFARVHTRPEWVAYFKATLAELEAEGRRRNSIIHSQILFEFAEKGVGPPLLSSRIIDRGSDALFEQIWLTKDYQQQLLDELRALATKISFIYTQLIHDYQATTLPSDQ